MVIARKCIVGTLSPNGLDACVIGCSSWTFRKAQNQIRIGNQYNSVIVDWPQNSCKICATLLITQSRQTRTEVSQIVAFMCCSDNTCIIHVLLDISVDSCLRGKAGGGQKVNILG